MFISKHFSTIKINVEVKYINFTITQKRRRRYGQPVYLVFTYKRDNIFLSKF
jgi:hypothetical protein